jgi:hypothetical protein
MFSASLYDLSCLTVDDFNDGVERPLVVDCTRSASCLVSHRSVPSRRSGFQAPHEKVVYHGQYWQIACQSHFSGQQGAFAYGPETGRCGRHFARRMYQRGALERYGKGHSG